MQDTWFALGLTLFAGLATGIGSIVAFFAKRQSHRFLSITTGFSAGVMLYVSFVEIFFKGAEALKSRYGDYWGDWINLAAFFAGILSIALIDNLIPEAENPHETHSDEELSLLQGNSPAAGKGYTEADKKIASMQKNHNPNAQKRTLLRMGLFTALAITIHNFPEGLATFVSALQDPSLGVALPSQYPYSMLLRAERKPLYTHFSAASPNLQEPGPHFWGYTCLQAKNPELCH